MLFCCAKAICASHAIYKCDIYFGCEMFLRNAVCCFENDFVGAGFHARGSSKRLPYNRYLPPLCKGRGTIEDGGGIVAYQMRRRHRTSSLLPFTYYFCTRDAEGVVPYSFSLRYVINAVCITKTALTRSSSKT